MTPRPLLLIILDGWGYRASSEYNAIAAAQKPNWDRLLKTYPNSLISGSGPCVGLPDGQMGNSEVGHLNMGAGRVVYQDFTRIEKSISDGEFFNNPTLLASFAQAKQHDSAVHVLGLLSSGGVHSHEQQIQALLQFAAQQGIKKLFLHAFLDGRDTPPKSALPSLEKTQTLLNELGVGKIASIIGRYYAMDRDKRWERVEPAYELLTEGKAPFHAENVSDALNQAYLRGESDEFVQATSIHKPDEAADYIQDNDVVIFMNFRADRARELSHSLVDEHFSGFKRQKKLSLSAFVTLTQYGDNILAQIVFPPYSMENLLGEYLARLGLKQLRIAETEKYAHVTFFFNGGIEPPNLFEDRVLIPSAKVATYDLKPEMSALEITDNLINAIASEKYDFIVCNFANPDMVGHTGNFDATVKAIETIDLCLGKIITALQKHHGEAIITADHGNAECMFDKHTQQPHTAHTYEPVPFIYVGRPAKIVVNDGKLSDIAPTILSLMQLKQPEEMTGRSLVKLENS